MRRNTEDKTIERSLTRKWRFLIKEYEETKAKKHPHYRFVTDFYRAHDLNRQTFCKYYNRYLNSGYDIDLLPRKRGPKWKSRRPDADVELAVLEQRKKGMNKFEISDVLRPVLHAKTPSPSGVYAILKRHDMNKLRPKMKEEKRKIIKEKAGELGHFDCHYLPKDLIVNSTKRYYLVCLLDDYSRLAWCHITSDIKSITVMFASMHCFNYLKGNYEFRFAEVLTDNGSEFSSRSEKSKMGHPFERMCVEMGIKHRYTRPYRPQTNGKVERFWRTLNEDLIEGTVFETYDEFEKELAEYMYYYNEMRPHQGIGGQAPAKFLSENGQRIT